jgi:uncharacterized membrane protein
MQGWLISSSKIAIVIIDGMAMVFLFLGTVQVFIRGLKIMLTSANSHERREVWLQFSRWLVAGLSIQLAADILETAIAPTWRDIGQLGAIAAIRTFLNYFLEKDMNEIRERDKSAEKKALPGSANDRGET